MAKLNEPYYVDNQLIQMTKGYTSPLSSYKSVYTTDFFEYISYYYDTHHTAMKYKPDSDLERRYGDASQYDCKFYLKQAAMYYQAAKNEPFEVSMLSSYYCMLNLAKSYISFKSTYVDEFVQDFSDHGIQEDYGSEGTGFEGISVRYKQQRFNRRNLPINMFGGVFPMFAGKLDTNFRDVWQIDDGKTLKTLLYNLPFVQSSYMNTYSTTKNRLEELFIPLPVDNPPSLYQVSSTRLTLKVDIDEGYLKSLDGEVSNEIISTITSKLKFEDGTFYSAETVTKNTNAKISGDLSRLNQELRKYFVYNGGNHALWYLKRTGLENNNVLNLSTLTINMAIMHRLSEIARYKPEQLTRLMNSNENWLLHEYMGAALDQFVDELASEITGRNVILSKW